MTSHQRDDQHEAGRRGEDTGRRDPAGRAADTPEVAPDEARAAAERGEGRASEPFGGSPGEEGPFPGAPSSLDFDRSASAARTGREELHEREALHTETGPEVTGGDIDADWGSAYAVGDEAPGGDNPTPDQDIVDDIGRALGVEYQDNEELKSAKKIEDRDRHRWELDPASSEDYQERNSDQDKDFE